MCRFFFLTVYGDSQPLAKISLNISQSHEADLGLQLQERVSFDPDGSPRSLRSSSLYHTLAVPLPRGISVQLELQGLFLGDIGLCGTWQCFLSPSSRLP